MQDKRSHPRATIDTEVVCEQRSCAAFTGKAKDISIGGMFIESTEILPFGTELTIAARFPRTKGEVRLPAIVRWAKPTGFGVQFGSLGARETHAISLLLTR